MRDSITIRHELSCFSVTEEPEVSNDKVSAPTKNAGNAVTMAKRGNRAVAVSLALPATIKSAHGQQMEGGGKCISS